MIKGFVSSDVHLEDLAPLAQALGLEVVAEKIGHQISFSFLPKQGTIIMLRHDFSALLAFAQKASVALDQHPLAGATSEDFTAIEAAEAALK